MALFARSVAVGADLDVDIPITSESRWPDTLVLPWEALNVDRDQIAKAAKALKQSQRELAETVITSPAPLWTKLPLEGRSNLNNKRLFEDILSGPGRKNRGSLVLMPIWVASQGRPLLMLLAATSDSNIILGVAHRVVSAEAWRNQIKRGNLANTFSPLIKEMWNELVEKDFKTPSPDLAIGLSIGAVSSRSDEIERNALN
ncbi:MAG: hypothetical protein NTV34_11395, partial [Proteobacteria bacterium]|nr:hypothetical protein [Pseudomonadota bacterium]